MGNIRLEFTPSYLIFNIKIFCIIGYDGVNSVLIFQDQTFFNTSLSLPQTSSGHPKIKINLWSPHSYSPRSLFHGVHSKILLNSSSFCSLHMFFQHFSSENIRFPSITTRKVHKFHHKKILIIALT